MSNFKIEEYLNSNGNKSLRLAGVEVKELFETVEETEVSGIVILNETHLARMTDKVKPVEIKGDKVIHEILITKNDEEIKTIVSAEVNDCEILARDNAKMLKYQARAVKDEVTDLSNKARDNQLTEEEKVKAVKETLKSLQLQGVEISTIKEIVAKW